MKIEVISIRLQWMMQQIRKCNKESWEGKKRRETKEENEKHSKEEWKVAVRRKWVGGKEDRGTTMLLNLSISAYEVKTKLSLFERPLTVKKNKCFFLQNPLSF